MHTSRCALLAFPLLLLLAGPLAADDKDKDFFKPKADPKETNPSGRAEMLRQMPKKFAELKTKDAEKRQITLLLDGDKEPTDWTINPDAELKRFGWWVDLNEFHQGARVWVWFDVDREKKPKSILMMCDEITQQEINDRPYTLTGYDVEAQTVTLKPAKGEAKILKMADGFQLAKKDDLLQFRVDRKGGPETVVENLKTGERVYVNTHAGKVSYLLDATGVDKLREDMKINRRNHWEHHGLPGTVVFLHPLSGEMELMLDHEAMRWGRNLKLGDKVKIKAENEIAAAVKEVRPWRERTQVRLVVDGFVQHDLTLGQRVGLLVPRPPPEVDAAELPPDIDRPRTKAERIEWFLASTYCSCSVGGNGCTGMFYTLASCNIHACGMPNAIRAKVGEMIDKGLTDKQIWEELKKSQGAWMLRPHLVP